jgi:hypothetical protein
MDSNILDSLSICKIRNIRNEALKHSNGHKFTMYGLEFTVPQIIFMANERLIDNETTPKRKAEKQKKTETL